MASTTGEVIWLAFRTFAASTPRARTNRNSLLSEASGQNAQVIQVGRSANCCAFVPKAHVVLSNFVEWRRPGRGGSHVIFSATGVREILSVPAKRPIKPVYIKQFVALIDAAGGITTK